MWLPAGFFFFSVCVVVDPATEISDPLTEVPDGRHPEVIESS
jgi:hypothetical protein